MNTDQSSPKAVEIASYARKLLSEGGYNSFSYADISAQVRISKASIHHHYPSKAQLVQQVVQQYREEACEGMKALARTLGDPLAELAGYVEYWSACIRSGTSSFCICAMLAAELPSLPGEIALEVRGHFEDLSGWLAAVMKRGVAQGQLRLVGSPADEAKAFMATVHGAMLSARAFGEPKMFLSIVQPSIDRITRAA
jgi:TetR/AcrR family transcriptional repressor of nem operon